MAKPHNKNVKQGNQNMDFCMMLHSLSSTDSARMLIMRVLFEWIDEFR